MVSKEVAKKSQDEAKKKNDEAKAKQDSQLSGSKQGRGDNRGYDYKSTDKSGYSVGADKGREFVEDPKGNRTYADQQNQQVQQAQQAQQAQQIKKESSNLSQTNQQANINFLEANARAGDQKSIDELRKQGREIYTIKQGPYEKTYIDDVPEDVVKQVNEGYKDEKDNYQNNYYVKDNFTEMISAKGESVQTNPLDEAKPIQSQPYAGFTENVGFSSAGSTAKIFPNVKKTRVEDTSNDELVKQVGVEKANEIIENRNRIIESNNLLIQQENKKNIDTFLSEGKKLGFKQVQVKTKDKTEFIDINKRSDFLKFGEGAEFTFVKTPEMKKQGRDVRLEQKKFIRDSKNIGSKFLIKAKTVNGKTFSEVIPIEQGYKEMIRNPDANFSSVPNVPKGYAIAGPIGSNILVSTEKPQEIKQEYSSDPFSKWVQEMSEYNPSTPDEKIQGPKKTTFMEESERFKRNLIGDYGSIITGGANFLKTGIQKISPNFMTNIGVAYQKENVATDFAFVPFKVGAEMIEEPPVNQTSTEIQPLQEEKLTPEQEKIKEKNKEWSTKDYYKKQQATWESYKGAVISQGSAVINKASKLPPARLASDIVGFGSTIVSPRTIVKGIPLRYTSTPFLSTEASQTLVRTLKFGYGEGKLLIGSYPQSGKIFIGKQIPQYSQIGKIEGPSGSSSFETYEFPDYSKSQLQDLKPIIEYGERTGTFTKTDMEKALFKGEVKKEIVQNRNMFSYEKTISPKKFEQNFEGMKGETLNVVSKQQSAKNLLERKGSGVINTLEGGIKTVEHDIDFSAKSVVKGQKASDALFKTGAKQGYKLKQSGKNISITKEGTEDFKEVFNIITPKEERVSAVSGLGKGKYYGEKIKMKKISQTIEGTTLKIKSQDFAQQVIDWGRSTGGIVSKRTLKGYKGDQDEFKDVFKFSKARIGFPLFHRAKKDITRDYFWGLRESARFAWKTGNKPLAQKIGKVMSNEYEMHKNWLDWKTSIKELRQSERLEFVSGSKTDSLKNFANKYQDIAGEGAYAGISTFSKPSSESKFSAKSPSVKSTSVFSVKSPSVKSTSVFSAKSPSIKSTSVFSTKSPSVKSTSVFSTKSPSVKSTSVFSAKSPSVKSPSIKSPSIKSPSIKSPSLGSPSIKSPSLGSPSIKSPSLGSPSIKSPSLGSPSIKSPSLKFPPYKQPPFILPKLGGNFGPKKNYFDKRKPAITFRWAVNNPIFKKFSIKEGKKGRTIEW